MKKGALVIIESTIAPGTMEKVVQPILEAESGLYANEGFFLAYCPERVRPGRLLENIQNYNRVLGGKNLKANQLAKKLYRYIVKADIVETDPLTAEVVKAGENTYRDVQIAFANELALICEAMGADIWEVRRLINDCKRADREVKPEDRLQVYFPGAGVGGHCLPKDPWLLIYGTKDVFEPKLIPLARNINDFMPRHTFNLLKVALEEAKKTIEKSKIVVLGYAYAGNSDDTRNTPSEILIEKILKTGAEVVVQDTFVKEYKTNLTKALKGAQAIIVMASHDQYKRLRLSTLKKLMRSKPIIIDGRNVFDKAKAQESGFIYRGVGNI
jgi:UDP-N-acetyl-D-mannosaminuronic acid dehydrogenase